MKIPSAKHVDVCVCGCVFVRKGTSSTGFSEASWWGKRTSWAGPTLAPSGQCDVRIKYAKNTLRNVMLTSASAPQQGLSAQSGGRWRHPLPEARGYRILAAALVTGQEETTLAVKEPRRDNGSMLSCQVCYTEGKHIQVRVHSEVFDPLTRQHNTTNVFHFTFVSDRAVPNVVPQTYGGERVLPGRGFPK